MGRPDDGISESATTIPARAATLATAEAPFQVGLVDADEERLSYIEIRDRDSWKLITVIELLSPGTNRNQYLGKRYKIQASSTHLVEIDLLRGGPRMPLRETPTCDYYVMVSRWQQRPRADFWPIQLRDRLPLIPVPLTEGHPEARLDLQVLLHRVYDSAGYENYIYRGEPEPPLSPADQQWAKSLLPV